MNIFLSRIHFPVTTLGPGRRIGIWLQGCSIRCSGCLSVDTWSTGKGGVSVDDIMEVISIWIKEAEGITISGGEPFDQPDALIFLLQQIRTKTNIDILVYSGHSFEKISPLINKYNGLIDAIISDPYDESAPQTLVLRGSDNQRLHCLTPLGETKFRKFNRSIQSLDNMLDIMFEDNGTVWLAGIPKRNDMHRLKDVLQKQGHIAKITSDKRSKNEEVL